MPRIIKLALGLAFLVVRGLNPAAGQILPPANAHALTPPPYSRNLSPFEWPQTPIDTPVVSSFSTTREQTKKPIIYDYAPTEAETRRARQFEIIREINKHLKNKDRKEYYLDQGTFTYLYSMLQKAQTKTTASELAALEYSYYIHLKAYFLLRLEHKNLPRLKQSLQKKYEALSLKFQSDTEDPITNSLVDSIKKKFKREVTPRELGMISMGARLQPNFSNQLYDGFREPKEKFSLFIFLDVVREIRGRNFQFDYEILAYSLREINNPEIAKHLPPEAIAVAQFATLTVKKETDYLASQYYFDSIMSTQWTFDEFNQIMAKTDLSLEELISVMDIEMPDHIKNIYVHYIADTLINQFVQENKKYTAREIGDKIKQYFDNNYPEMEMVYRSCMQVFLARLDNGAASVARYLFQVTNQISDYTGGSKYLAGGIFSLFTSLFLGKYAYGKWTTHKAAPDQHNTTLGASKPDREKKIRASINRGSASDQKKDKTEEKNMEDKNPEKKEQEVDPVDAKRRLFLDLITVKHSYSRKTDQAYIKIYQRQIGEFKNVREEWLQQSQMDQLHEFMGQLKLAFKSAGLNFDIEDNEIVRALNMKYHLLKSGVTQITLPTASAPDPSSLGDENSERLISDDYFPPQYDYHSDEGAGSEDDTHTLEERGTGNGASSSSDIQLPAKMTAQYDNQNALSVKPYLDAFGLDASPLALKHAYKILIIKFHESYKDRLKEKSPAHDYFRRLRNALAHDNMAVGDDLIDRLYVILITIERLQGNNANVNDLNNEVIQLEETLSPYNNSKKIESAEDKFIRLGIELNELYAQYYKEKEKLLHHLALINIFSEIAETLNTPQMQLILQQGDKKVDNAFKEIRKFRNTEYHCGRLRQTVNEVQVHYITLINYMQKVSSTPLPRPDTALKA